MGITCSLLAACQDDPQIPPITDLATDDGCGASCGCTADTECSAPTPRCHKMSGKCVACLPTDDQCPRGSRCVETNGTFACAPGCDSDKNCPASDGGASLACCGGACLDTRGDSQNCGMCGKACMALPHAMASCVAGACVLGACNAGFADCDGKPDNGCETSVADDLRNCGKCGAACPVRAHEMASCVGGACQAACAAGFAHCSADPADGCEVEPGRDVKNCGSCGKVCPLPVQATTAGCVAGQCTVAACVPGYADCNGNAQDGCEVALQNDLANCGVCGRKCVPRANSSSVCMAGLCGLGMCQAGFDDCDRDGNNGCEVALQNDSDNCGLCGRRCVGPSSTQVCQAGVCKLLACDGGFDDCDKKLESGCEVALNVDVLNCGSCGNSCPAPANGYPGCAFGRCGVAGCKVGFADCNFSAVDGCETSLITAQDCGACGNICPSPPNALPACLNGRCGMGQCAPLFADCNFNPNDGCERNIGNDPFNCGACNKSCSFPNAVPACQNGNCGFVQCNVGFGDCDGNQINGCEQSVLSDPRNCGACGVTCPMNKPFCLAGVCGATVHNTVAWPNQFNYVSNSCNVGANGVLIGNFQAVNLGAMTWKACMIEGSKRSAMVTTPSYGSWPQPGWWAVRQPQGFNPNLAMTGQWANYISQDINNNAQCNVMHEPQSVALGQFNSKGPLANTISYDGNSWHYEDFGPRYIDECTLLAGQYGASIITPWTIGLPNGDNYWQGILHTCSVYSWSAGNGTSLNYDNTTGRSITRSCMLGWIDG